MNVDSPEFLKIGSIIQLAEMLKRDPKKAVEHIRKYRDHYLWITDDQINSIEKESSQL